MNAQSPEPVSSFENLRDRVDKLFSRKLPKSSSKEEQLSFDLFSTQDLFGEMESPYVGVKGFLDLLADKIPVGDMYIFGGLLRDVALFGKSGFKSDIDLVIDGEWDSLIPFLERSGATKNKFGGFRLAVSGQPIDIWNARHTWAIEQGYVNYDGIASLTDTTVLNWDAILMNWRTKNFICKPNYLAELKSRTLNIVLEDNPNPIGMAVRVFRHLCLKDAKAISDRTVNYLAKCTRTFSYEQIAESELRSYGSCVIERAIYNFFELVDGEQGSLARERLNAATESAKRRGLALSFLQFEHQFDAAVTQLN